MDLTASAPPTVTPIAGDLEPVLDAVGLASWELDSNGILSWSVGLPDLLGLPRTDRGAIEVALLTLLAPVLVSSAAAGWEDYAVDQEYDRPDGATELLRLHARVVRGTVDSLAAPPHLVGVLSRADERAADKVESDDRYRILVELSPDGHVVHQNGKVVYANPSTLRLVGCTREQLVGHPITDFVSADSQAAMMARIAELHTPGMSSTPAEAHLLHRDGSDVAVESVSVLTRWQNAPAYQVILRDLSGEKAAAATLRMAEERYTTAVEALDEGVILIDGTGRVQSCNPAAAGILGLTPESLVGKVLLDAVAFVGEHGWALPHETNPVELARTEGRPRDKQAVGFMRGDRTQVWLSLSARVIPGRKDGSGHPIVLSFSDITERRLVASRLEHEARHDDLTGLANRKLVLERLAALLDRAPAGGVAVLFIDIDRFKTVNDSLGHEAGNQLLVEIAQRLRRVGGRAEVIGRLAGDEFVFVASGVGAPDAARALAHRMLDVIARPIDVDGRAVVVTASIGVALVSRPPYENGEEILRDADVAMYRAKEEGRSRVVLFDHELRASAVHRLELQEDLRGALRAGDVWPAFQPLIGLADGRVTGTEALARWVHPERGHVSPAEFIPVAEETGMIVPLGEHILLEACARTAEWHAQGLPGLGVSVNLSTRQFSAASLPDMISAVLSKTGLSPAHLTLEITESVLMHDPDAAARTLLAIKDLGVRLSLDDFGTGYSSLAYLRRFPVDTVKIDRSFVQEVCDDAADRAIVASIIQLAHTLDLTVTAEGVELPEQHALLRDLECDSVQGFLHARPVPGAELPATIERIHTHPAG